MPITPQSGGHSPVDSAQRTCVVFDKQAPNSNANHFLFLSTPIIQAFLKSARPLQYISVDALRCSCSTTCTTIAWRTCCETFHNPVNVCTPEKSNLSNHRPLGRKILAFFLPSSQPAISTLHQSRLSSTLWCPTLLYTH
jgi:hypothetical protein